MLCFRVLTDYLHLLEDWKVRYAPKTPEDALDDRFVEACQMHCHIEYMADVLTVGDLEERVALVDKLMYAAKERETLVIETAHILSFGLFLCPQAFEKVSVDIGCKRKLTQNSFMQTGLTMGKGADIFALVSRGHRSDRIPPRESPRRAHGTLQPVWMKV